MGYVGVKRSVASKIGASTNSFNSSSSVKDSKGLIKVEGKKKKIETTQLVKLSTMKNEYVAF
jgi:hypothetical protein